MKMKIYTNQSSFEDVGIPTNLSPIPANLPSSTIIINYYHYRHFTQLRENRSQVISALVDRAGRFSNPRGDRNSLYCSSVKWLSSHCGTTQNGNDGIMYLKKMITNHS